MTVFWDIVQGADCWRCKHLWNVDEFLPDYTTQ
jgi:hypothetical protein